MNRDIDSRIEVYKRDVDRTLLRKNLKLAPEQRLAKLMAHQQFAAALREAGRKACELQKKQEKATEG